MSKSVITDSLLKDIADAIRAKTGGAETMTPAEMAAEIEAIPAGGGGYTAAEIADGSYTGSMDTGEATAIKAWAFMGGHMDSISGAEVVTIGEHAFASARVISVSFPRCTTCGDYAFYACRNLQTVNLPLLQTVPKYCFDQDSELKNIALPAATWLRQQCLSPAVETVDLPAVQTLDSFAFYNLPKLEEIWLPSISVINASAFNTLAGLRTLKLGGTPASLPATICYKCTALADIYVPWSEGAIAGAPWGATNATIHYDTTYDANGDPIE